MGATGVGLVTLRYMEPTYPSSAEPFREKIQAFLAEHLPADWSGIGALPSEAQEHFVTEWRQILADNRL